ncbi:DedA family protein [Aurantimonas sp. MSK8Z-1]|uniref:DedA family protein n=1 Tax=Mangrovibrevibacter kandeliae TaxID=2968473 RepID=UPI0021185350|nr:DedA family protein [Aurantimonas sp. MSK8Z-1]MCW4115060.1 DedA family protein [Aurantimonas sp. MSK8Z-1]
MHGILQTLSDAIIALISSTGLLGVALLMALESACLPIPSELIMPFAGYLVSTGQFSLIGVALAGAIGCNIGSLVAYQIGARGGRPLVERWSDKTMFGKHELDLAERFFARWGASATFVGRLLPVVRTFIALPAGIARMNPVVFHVYTFVGSFIWCLGLAWVGQLLGAHWNDSAAMKTAFHVADVVIVLAVVAALVWYLRRRRRASAVVPQDQP